LNFEIICKRDVRSRDRDETEKLKKTPRDRLETETFETETTTLRQTVVKATNLLRSIPSPFGIARFTRSARRI